MSDLDICFVLFCFVIRNNNNIYVDNSSFDVGVDVFPTKRLRNFLRKLGLCTNLEDEMTIACEQWVVFDRFFFSHANAGCRAELVVRSFKVGMRSRQIPSRSLLLLLSLPVTVESIWGLFLFLYLPRDGLRRA